MSDLTLTKALACVPPGWCTIRCSCRCAARCAPWRYRCASGLRRLGLGLSPSRRSLLRGLLRRGLLRTGLTPGWRLLGLLGLLRLLLTPGWLRCLLWSLLLWSLLRLCRTARTCTCLLRLVAANIIDSLDFCILRVFLWTDVDNKWNVVQLA